MWLKNMINTQEKSQQKLAVVLGATGAVGSAVVRKLIENKELVRAVSRNIKKAKKMFDGLNVECIKADLQSKEETKKAIVGGTVVYHCAGIPYTKWLKTLPLIQKNIIEALTETKATLVYADNLYMYGRMQEEKISEKHPENPTSKKGLLRKKLAEELLEAHKEGRIKVVIVRTGDYYGPNVVNGFTTPLFQNPLAGKPAAWIGSLDQKHSLIYIDDVAKGLVLIAEHPELFGQIWHVEGGEALTGQEFIEMIYSQVGIQQKIKVLKRSTLNFLSPFVPIVKELKELLDEWEYPFIIDGSKFKETMGVFHHTPHKIAIEKTCNWFKENC